MNVGDISIGGKQYEVTSIELNRVPKCETQQYSLVLRSDEETLVVQDFAYNFQAWPQEQAAKLTWYCHIAGWGEERGKTPYLSDRVLRAIEDNLNTPEIDRHFEFAKLTIHKFAPKTTFKHIRQVLA